jgi:hypothetical protein
MNNDLQRATNRAQRRWEVDLGLLVSLLGIGLIGLTAWLVVVPASVLIGGCLIGGTLVLIGWYVTEQHYERLRIRFGGDWVLLVIALLLASFLFWFQGWGADRLTPSASHTHQHSPAYHGTDTSWLNTGKQADSRLRVYDGEADRSVAIVQGYGCGREWIKRNFKGIGTSASLETNCNLAWHRTGEEYAPNGVLQGNPSWGGTSIH